MPFILVIRKVYNLNTVYVLLVSSVVFVFLLSVGLLTALSAEYSSFVGVLQNTTRYIHEILNMCRWEVRD